MNLNLGAVVYFTDSPLMSWKDS